MKYEIEPQCLFSSDTLTVAIAAGCTIAAGMVAIAALLLYLRREARKVENLSDNDGLMMDYEEYRK